MITIPVQGKKKHIHVTNTTKGCQCEGKKKDVPISKGGLKEPKSVRHFLANHTTIVVRICITFNVQKSTKAVFPHHSPKLVIPLKS
jgi:hypothetical protein